MQNPLELFREFLQDRTTMQLATLDGDQPWICTVRFVVDDSHNIYWASEPDRRHSKDIMSNQKVACAIVVQDLLDQPVIGIQIEGSASLLEPPLEVGSMVEKYAKCYGRTEQWINDFTQGRTKHRFYKLTPSAIYLFDEVHFPGGGRQQIL